MTEAMKMQANVEQINHSPAAKRMRLHRERRRAGMRCLIIELRETEIDALIRKGFLKADTRHDTSEIIDALYAYFDRELTKMTKTARDELAKYGIAIAFTDDGAVELTSRRGITCGYSSRGYSPVIGFGADGRIMIRLAGCGFRRKRTVIPIDCGQRSDRSRTAFR
jgi:hypothetical protein